MFLFWCGVSKNLLGKGISSRGEFYRFFIVSFVNFSAVRIINLRFFFYINKKILHDNRKRKYAYTICVQFKSLFIATKRIEPVLGTLHDIEPIIIYFVLLSTHRANIA